MKMWTMEKASGPAPGKRIEKLKGGWKGWYYYRKE